MIVSVPGKIYLGKIQIRSMLLWVKSHTRRILNLEIPHIRTCYYHLRLSAVDYFQSSSLQSWDEAIHGQYPVTHLSMHTLLS